ncbi:unnamed protein product [Bemisia tabaci]|uniref:DUF3719 domain-containing protein n=1 Tax=Bemisia tabaci TaxID=7038 RepID=A0A9P0AA06_BEMTA|nr:unnamed protein product [Bemisia tabaci]
MPNNVSKRNSRSGKSKTGQYSYSQSTLPVPGSVKNFFEVSGHAFIELSTNQRLSKINKSLKLPVLNPASISRTQTFLGAATIKSSVSTCQTERRELVDDNSVKSETNSQPSFIRSLSASESESWSDDLENEATAHLLANLTHIDDMLYCTSPVTSNQELFHEIKLWQSRFPFLRVVGKKVKILDNSTSINQETSREKEEVIFNDTNLTSTDLEPVTSNSGNIVHLKKQLRRSVIDHLTTHFIYAMKDEIIQCSKHEICKPASKVNKAPTCRVDKISDINDNSLRVHDLDNILNISPISLKATGPKSNYLSSFSTNRVRSIQAKSSVSQPIHLRIEQRTSTKITQQPFRNATDNVKISIVANLSKTSKPAKKSSELKLRKDNLKTSKNIESSTSNRSRFCTLPPLKTPGLRPTSAIYSSFKKLPSDSRPTSSFILAPSALMNESSENDLSL